MTKALTSVPAVSRILSLNWVKERLSAVPSDVKRNFAETYLTRILLVAVGLVLSVIVTRLLGPSGRGSYAVALSLATIGVQFGNFGLQASNTYFVARDRSLLPKLFANTLVSGAGAGAIAALLLWLSFFARPSLAPVHGLLLIVAPLWIPFGIVNLLFQNLLLGLDKVRALNTVEVVTKVSSLILIGVLLLSNFVSPETVFLATLAGLIVGVVSNHFILRRDLNTPANPSFDLFKMTLRYGLKVYLASFFTYLIMRLDLLMVKYQLGATDAGYFSVAMNLAETILILPSVAGAMLFAKLAASRGSRQNWDLTNASARIIVVVMLIFLGLAAILARPAVHVLFGPLFSPSAASLTLLLPGILFLSLTSVYSAYVASIGQPVSYLVATAIAITVNFFLDLFFLRKFGLSFASVSCTITCALLFAMTFLISAFHYKGIRDRC